MLFPSEKQLANAGRTLGLKGGSEAVRKKAGIHSPAYKKKRKAAKKTAAPAKKKPAARRKATGKKNGTPRSRRGR